VEDLIAKGYKRISNAHGHIARIDREDWLEVLAVMHNRAPADFIVRDGTGRPSPNWEDYYRRCVSEDIHTVSEEDIKKFPSSF
jgi:hypothetical protein